MRVLFDFFINIARWAWSHRSAARLFYVRYRQPPSRISAFFDQVLLQTQLRRMESDAGATDGNFDRLDYFRQPHIRFIDVKRLD